MSTILPFPTRPVATTDPDAAPLTATIGATDQGTIEIDLPSPTTVIGLTPATAVTWATALLTYAILIDPDVTLPPEIPPGA